MTRAIELARQCPPGSARVGAVIADRDRVLGEAARDGSSRKHAEELALIRAAEAGNDVRGAQIYTTLEPCANSEGHRIPCAQLLQDAGIGAVYIGSYDKSFRVYRLGWRQLRDAGVTLREFDRDLLPVVRALGEQFAGYFTHGTGPHGRARFDFTQNGGRFTIAATADADSPTWETHWTNCGAEAIYAYGGVPGVVAHPRFARAFEEVADVDEMLDYGGSSQKIPVGELAVFRNEHGHVLCRVDALEPTPDYGGSDHASVTITWEIRPQGAADEQVEP